MIGAMSARETYRGHLQRRGPGVASSGVVGAAGRYELAPVAGPSAADFTLAGEPLPLVGALRIYSCGITPYAVTHLGHAATFMWVDLLASVARAVDVVPHVARNVTDVDDVLTAAALRARLPYDEFALTQEFLFDRDMTALGITRPSVTPHARAHVSNVIDLAEALLRLGRAYERAGTVWFRAPDDIVPAGLDAPRDRFAEFGDAEGGDGREGEWDVALWRPSADDDPAWPSPWGWGRPAWHVECAAMALGEFGSGVDVIVGGADLIFPHHAYQAAMAEAATGQQPFARRALHVGTVHFQGAKMAKSTDNLVLVRDLLEQVPGPVVRLLLLNRSWSQPWEYAASDLEGASDQLDAIHVAAGRPGADPAARAAVLAALLDDLDVPTAIGRALDAGGDAARVLIDLLKL